MSKSALCFFAILVLVGIPVVPDCDFDSANGYAASQEDLQPLTVRGEIWDSVCAAASTHGKMMAKTQAKDVKECTLACVKAGAQLVLYNLDDKTIYRLDSQDKVKEYAGQKVTVIGNYDRATGVLHVDRVETIM